MLTLDSRVVDDHLVVIEVHRWVVRDHPEVRVGNLLTHLTLVDAHSEVIEAYSGAAEALPGVTNAP
jgi:hypothetical protein